MDVLLITNTTDSPFLDQQIEALEDRGVSVTTLAMAGTAADGPIRRGLAYLDFFPRVARAARGEYDLLHAHYGLTGPMAVAQRSLPTVLTLWGTDLYGPGAPISRASARRCDEVIVMTEDMREMLGQDCHVVQFGVDLDRFRPMAVERARAQVGWNPEAHHVLFPYAPDRDVKDYPRARAVVDRVADRMDRPVRLQAVHGVDHRSMVTYVNAADALLLTSKSEGSPTSVKEALACNLPVVSIDVGDVRERLAGVDPSVVATDDEELVEGVEAVLRRGERSNGRAAARAVSLDGTVDRLLDVYDRALGERSRRTAERRVSTPRP